MEQSQDRLIDRIKKLLALADNNPSAEEAASAAAMAMRLMRKYNLESADLQAHELRKEGAIIRAVVENGPNYKVRVASWFNVLVTGVAQSLSCETTLGYNSDRTGVTMYLYGARQDVEVANWLINYLRVQIDKLADAHWQNKSLLIRLRNDRAPYASERTREKNNYRFGLAVSVLERVKEVYGTSEEDVKSASSANALVVLKNQLIRERFPNLPATIKINQKHSEALRRGYRDAEKINVQRIVHNNLQKPVALID